MLLVYKNLYFLLIIKLGDEFSEEIEIMLVNSKNGQIIVMYGGNKIRVLKRGNKVLFPFFNFIPNRLSVNLFMNVVESFT